MKTKLYSSIYNRSDFKKDIIIIVLIFLMPFLIYLHNFFPSVKEINNDYINFTSIYFEDIRTWAWVVLSKLVYVLIFILWFITCKHWWRYFLLIPQVFFAVQMISALNDDIRFIDDFNILYGILFSLPIVYFTYYLGKKVNYYSFTKSLSMELDREIEQLIEDISVVKSSKLRNINLKLNLLRNNKSKYDKHEYLTKLLELRKEFNI